MHPWSDVQLTHVKIGLLVFKGIIMQIEKALINERLHVLKRSWKFCIPANYNFTNISSADVNIQFTVKSCISQKIESLRMRQISAAFFPNELNKQRVEII